MSVEKLTIPIEELKDLKQGQKRVFDFNEGAELPRDAVLVDKTGKRYCGAQRISIQTLEGSLAATYLIKIVY